MFTVNNEFKRCGGKGSFLKKSQRCAGLCLRRWETPRKTQYK